MCDVERSLSQMLDEDVYELVIEHAAADGVSPRSIVNDILRGYYEVHGPMRVLVRERDEAVDEALSENRLGIDLSHFFDDVDETLFENRSGIDLSHLFDDDFEIGR